MATRSHTDGLAAVPLFEKLSKRDLQRVADVATELQVEPGKLLVSQGRPGDELFVILDGKALVRRNDRKVGEMGPGEYFGELSLLDRLPRAADVVAHTPMRVLVIDRDRFQTVLREVPDIATTLLASMAARLREAHAKAASL